MTAKRQVKLFSGPGLLALGALLMASCGSTNTTATPTATHLSPTVKVSTNAKLGQVLVNSKGMTLYYLTGEVGGKLLCSGSCLSLWPPATASAASPTGAGLTGKLSTIALSSGKSQLTYNGWPLYLYSGDSKPGQTNGQGISFGSAGVWRAATPSLTASTSAPTSSSSPSSGW